MIDFVVGFLEEHVGSGGSRFFESIRSLALCACVTKECVSPGIRKLMSVSFSIVSSWLGSSNEQRASSFFTKCFVLWMLLSWQERVWELSGTFSVFVFNNKSLGSLMRVSNVEIFAVFRYTCLNGSFVTFAHLINRQEENCLFLARTLTSRCKSTVMFYLILQIMNSSLSKTSCHCTH